jgi:hypothetical protein
MERHWLVALPLLNLASVQAKCFLILFGFWAATSYRQEELLFVTAFNPIKVVYLCVPNFLLHALLQGAKITCKSIFPKNDVLQASCGSLHSDRHSDAEVYCKTEPLDSMRLSASRQSIFVFASLFGMASFGFTTL